MLCTSEASTFGPQAWFLLFCLNREGQRHSNLL
jgi:hypothetical protein